MQVNLGDCDGRNFSCMRCRRSHVLGKTASKIAFHGGRMAGSSLALRLPI